MNAKYLQDGMGILIEQFEGLVGREVLLRRAAQSNHESPGLGRGAGKFRFTHHATYSNTHGRQSARSTRFSINEPYPGDAALANLDNHLVLERDFRAGIVDLRLIHVNASALHEAAAFAG